MIDQDFHRFSQVFNQLTLAFPGFESTSATQRVYWETLKVLRLEAVERGAAVYREIGGTFFPSTSEWYEHAKPIDESLAIDELKRLLPPARPVPWRYYCDVCDDTAWEIRFCIGTSDHPPPRLPYWERDRCVQEACGRDWSHYQHPFAVPCLCRTWNPVWKRRLAMAEERPTVIRARGGRKRKES